MRIGWTAHHKQSYDADCTCIQAACNEIATLLSTIEHGMICSIAHTDMRASSVSLIDK